jgi:hypothetical protein
MGREAKEIASVSDATGNHIALMGKIDAVAPAEPYDTGPFET